MPKLLRKIDKERLVELYINQKLYIREISVIESREGRISPNGVLTWLREYGIKTRSISEARKGRKYRS